MYNASKRFNEISLPKYYICYTGKFYPFKQSNIQHTNWCILNKQSIRFLVYYN